MLCWSTLTRCQSVIQGGEGPITQTFKQTFWAPCSQTYRAFCDISTMTQNLLKFHRHQHDTSGRIAATSELLQYNNTPHNFCQSKSHQDSMFTLLIITVPGVSSHASASVGTPSRACWYAWADDSTRNAGSMVDLKCWQCTVRLQMTPEITQSTTHIFVKNGSVKIFAWLPPSSSLKWEVRSKYKPWNILRHTRWSGENTCHAQYVKYHANMETHFPGPTGNISVYLCSKIINQVMG